MKDLEILGQKTIEVGIFLGVKVEIYPASITRYHEIMAVAIKSRATMFEMQAKIDKIKQSGNLDKRMKELDELYKLQIKSIVEQIPKIAPIVVMMTAKPDEKYNWQPVLDEKDIATKMDPEAIIEIMEAYDKTAKIPDALKKITALSG